MATAYLNETVLLRTRCRSALDLRAWKAPNRRNRSTNLSGRQGIFFRRIGDVLPVQSVQHSRQPIGL